SVHLLALSPEKTSIRIQAKLMMEKFAIYRQERSVDWFEAYLRQDLFRKICKNLYRKANQCDALFPDYYIALGTCPAPRGPVEVDEEKVRPEEQALARQAPQTPQVSKAPGKAVKKAQQALADAGYNPGPVDGKIGVRTRSALIEFQQMKGISDSGELDQATLMALGL
ncbi:MAG: peptidoglycan binding protein, partial [uncultured bacterium]